MDEHRRAGEAKAPVRRLALGWDQLIDVPAAGTLQDRVVLDCRRRRSAVSVGEELRRADARQGCHCAASAATSSRAAATRTTTTGDDNSEGEADADPRNPTPRNTPDSASSTRVD